MQNCLYCMSVKFSHAMLPKPGTSTPFYLTLKMKKWFSRTKSLFRVFFSTKSIETECETTSSPLKSTIKYCNRLRDGQNRKPKKREKCFKSDERTVSRRKFSTTKTLTKNALHKTFRNNVFYINQLQLHTAVQKPGTSRVFQFTLKTERHVVARWSFDQPGIKMHNYFKVILKTVIYAIKSSWGALWSAEFGRKTAKNTEKALFSHEFLISCSSFLVKFMR